MHSFQPPISTTQDKGFLHLSRWLEYTFLIDTEEIKELFAACQHPHLIHIYSAIELEKYCIQSSDFLHHYDCYITALKNTTYPNTVHITPWLSAAWTASLTSLWAMQIKESSFLIKSTQPFIYVKPATFAISRADFSLRATSANSPNPLHWGLTLSYPQIAQNTRDGVARKIIQDPGYPNSSLFHTVRKWLRANTIPIKFVIHGTVCNTHFRLGKQCLNWINNHPFLRDNSDTIQMD